MNEISTITDTKIASMKDANIYLAEEFINCKNPITTLFIPNADYELQFMQTKQTLLDVEKYKSFISNAIQRFRRSRSYKGYKAYLMSLGMDRCQIYGNITDEMADIEMHHNIITIYDIAILITEHILNTIGRITTFDLVSLLIQEHRLNNIPIVMLSKTAHQLYHDDPDFYIPLSMTFGQWWNLLFRYRYGITLDIAYKTVKYISNCQKNNELQNLEMFQLRDTIMNWGNYNEYNQYNIINNYNNNFINSAYVDNANESLEYFKIEEPN